MPLVCADWADVRSLFDSDWELKVPVYEQTVQITSARSFVVRAVIPFAFRRKRMSATRGGRTPRDQREYLKAYRQSAAGKAAHARRVAALKQRSRAR
jgi:hypothetical protein